MRKIVPVIHDVWLKRILYLVLLASLLALVISNLFGVSRIHPGAG